MSYLVLARKYRPRNFTEMVGQEAVVQALSNALTQQRLHHAYLFTGTRGVGKTTVSRILAKSLNCTGADGLGGITAHPCGVCAACRDIDSGRFVDYVELDAASNRGVDEISQLLDQSVYKPVLGRFKVYMIDEVHMLTTTAFNAMLKTLEEPPDYLKFVLATTDPQKVPVTVLSRCLQFNLRPMAPVTVLEHLQHVLQQEAIEAEPGALRLLARAARGSMRDGLSLTDQAIAFGAGQIDEAGVRQMLGAVDRSHVYRIIEAVAASDGVALVQLADALRAEGLSAAGTLEELALVAQQMAVLQAVPQAADADDPDTPALQAVAALLPPDETQLMYSLALHGRAELGLAPDEYAGLTMVLLRLLTFRPASAVASGTSGSSGASGTASGRTSPAEAAAPRALASGAGGRAAPVAAPGVSPAAPPQAARMDLLRPSRPALSVPAPAPIPVEARPQSTAPSVAPQPAVRPPVAARAAPASAAAVPPWEDIPAVDLDAPSVSMTPVEPFDGTGTVLDASVAATRPSPDVTAIAAIPAVSAVADSSPQAGDAAVTEPCQDAWVEAVRQVLAAGALTALARELALQSQCVAYQAAGADGGGAKWLLRVERESLRQAGHLDRLVKALREFGADPAASVELEAGSVVDCVARRDAEEKARRQTRAEAAFSSDERVVNLLARYPTARVVPGSVRPPA